MASIVRSAEAEAESVSGVVRLRSLASVSAYLIERLPALYARHPDLKVDLLETHANLGIARHEADIAIRGASSAADADD